MNDLARRVQFCDVWRRNRYSGVEPMPRKKVLRTIKPTPLKGTLKTKDIERAVDVVTARRQRPKPEPKATVQA
jgi:hypothetical protein